MLDVSHLTRQQLIRSAEVKVSLAFLIQVGLLFSGVSGILPKSLMPVTLGLFLLSVVLNTWGGAHWTAAKGYTTLIGAPLGLIGIPGLVLILVMPDRRKHESAETGHSI